MRTFGKVLAILVVIGLGLAFGYRVRAAKRTRAAVKASAPTAIAAPVKVEKVTRRDVRDIIEITGNVRPRVAVEVYPELPGRVEELHVVVGQVVKAGEPIAVLEHDELTAQSRQAWAQAKAAKAALEQAKVGETAAKTQWDRAKILHEKGALAKAQLEGAEVTYQSAVAAVHTAEAQVGVVSSTAGVIAVSVANSKIASPIAGTVVKVGVDVGSQAVPQRPLVEIHDATVMELEAAVPADQFGRLTLGIEADVTLEELPGVGVKGKVSSRSPVLDPVTRRAPIEISIDNADGKLLANMFAHVSIVVGERKGVVTIPARAVVALPTGRVVFLLRDGKAVRVKPELGARDGDQIVVEKGIAEGDTVIVAGMESLADGADVVVTK